MNINQTVKELLTEIIQCHADPDDPGFYNECDKEECYWCTQAKAVISALDSTGCSGTCGSEAKPDVAKAEEKAAPSSVPVVPPESP